MEKQRNTLDCLSEELINEISDQDRQLLDEWSQAHPEQENFRSLINQMKLAPHILEKGESMREEILQQVNIRIDKARKTKITLRIIGVAASLLIVFGFSNYFSYQQGYKQQNSQVIELSNPLGMRSSVTLPDGSKVTLNAGTHLSYPSVFTGKNREVSIRGEAFFEVAKDPERPFIVKAEDVKVQVFGTEFNVKAYEEERRIEVSLTEGKVGVKVEGLSNILHLNPGEQAYYDKSNRSLTSRTVNIMHYTSWREGKYYFNALPLSEIASQLERGFNVHIDIASAELENVVLTGDFIRGENLEQILRVMTADQRLHYTIDGDMINIKEK